ncbi:MAG: hypothetical protein WCF24_02500 [Acidimicrobiales bacterium]
MIWRRWRYDRRIRDERRNLIGQLLRADDFRIEVELEQPYWRMIAATQAPHSSVPTPRRTLAPNFAQILDVHHDDLDRSMKVSLGEGLRVRDQLSSRLLARQIQSRRKAVAYGRWRFPLLQFIVAKP